MATLTKSYVLHEHIASGRFGTVYRATDIERGTHHAVKRLQVKRQDIDAAKNSALLRAELKHWECMSQKSGFILPLERVIHDEHEGEMVCFMVSPYCEGGNLRTAALKLPLDHKIRIARQLAMAVASCHENGILHGDIKPENVLAHFGRAQLCDFGSSTECNHFTEGAYVKWMTLNYAPPEALGQTAGKDGVGFAADMWALGVTLYELLHDMEAMPFDNRKKLPDGMRLGFPTNDPLDQQNVYWPASTRHTIANPKARGLCEVILGCLERNPKDRISAIEIIDTLARR